MSILAIDYGRKNLGLAVSLDRKVVHPLRTLGYQEKQEALQQLRGLLEEYTIEKVVVGLPLDQEGNLSAMAKEALNFGQKVERELGKNVFFQNETLTSTQAQMKAVLLGVPRKKRRQKQHSLAAALILQDFLSQKDPRHKV